MCFRFGSCFGTGSRQDYGRSASRATHHGYYSGADHKSGPQAYHNQSAAANDEPVRTAGAGVRKDHFDDDAGGHGSYYGQYKSGGEVPKQPLAWSGKVGAHAADYAHTYMSCLHDAAADHQREEAAADYHHYPATTTKTTLARY